MSMVHLLFISFALKFCNAQCFANQEKPFHRAHDYDFHICIDEDSEFQSCCIGNDTCYTDSICLSSSPYTATSGYYIGGCTDHTYSDTSCSRHCRDLSWQDIVFNGSADLWSCCQKLGSNDDDVDCRDPGNETFYAPAPTELEELSSTSTLPLSSTSALSTKFTLRLSSTSTSSTSTSSSIGTLTASPSSTPNTSSHSSTVIKIGIGFGAFFGSSAILTGSILIFLRRSKRVGQGTDTQGILSEGTEIAHVHQVHPAEANGESATQEVFSTPVSEMPLSKE